MQTFDDLILEVAMVVGCGPKHLAGIIDDLASKLRRDTYYVYRRPASGGGDRVAPPTRGRSIPAFASPDDALTFARYGQVNEIPRVRALTTSQLLLTLAKDSGLAAMIFLEEPIERLPLSQQPGAIRIARRQILDALDAATAI